MRLVEPRTKEVPLSEPTGAAAGLAGGLLFPITFGLADSAALLIAATASHWLPGTAEESGWQGFLPGVHFAYPLVFWIASMISLSAFGFYDRLRTAFRKHELIRLYRVFALSVIVAATIAFALNGQASVPLAYVATWVMAPPAVAISRGLVRAVRRQVLPSSMLSVPVLILGEGGTVERLTQHLESLPELDLAPISSNGDGAAGGPAALDETLRLAGAHGVRQVVVARAVHDENEMIQVAAICQEAGLRVTWLPPTMGLPMRVSSLQLWEGAPVIGLVGEGSRQAYERAKRVLDLVGAGVVTLALLPLMATVAMAIKLDSGGPALIRQTRVGRGSRPFQMYKFRSMKTVSMEIPEELRHRNEAAGPMFKMRRDPRVSRVGRFIRRASIDELPQLFNVLLGEMSLVGPRPPLPRELPGYNEVQQMRLTVTPGITGMWQVNGRSELTFEEMLDLDLEYIKRRSLVLDILILLRTVPTVLSGRGAC